MKENFIFDLYGTLVSIHTDEKKRSFWTKMAEIYSGFGANYSAMELKKAYLRLCAKEEKKLQKKYGAYAEIELRKVFVALFREKGVAPKKDLVEYIGVTFRVLSRSHIYVYDGVFDLFEEIKAQGKKIYLLSNAQNVFTVPELKVTGLYDWFDGIYISSDKHMKKPDGRFLEQLLIEYGLDKEASIMIGNDRTSDIAVANACGVDSLYIHSENSYPDRIRPKSEKEKATYEVLDGDVGKVKKLLL